MKILQHASHQDLNGVELGKCNLLLLIEKEFAYWALLNSLENKVLLVSKLTYNNVSEIPAVIQSCDIDTQLLRKMIVVFNTKHSIVLPSHKSDATLQSHLADLFFPYEQGMTVLKDDIEAYNLHHLFQVNQTHIDILNPLSEQIDYFHFHTLFINLTAVKIEQAYTKTKHFARVVVSDKRVTMVVFSNQKLLYVNAFEMTSVADYVYNIIYVIEELKIPNAEMTLYLNFLTNENIGDSTKGLLMMYFEHVEIENRPIVLDYDTHVEQLEVHEFAPLFDLFLCV